MLVWNRPHTKAKIESFESNIADCPAQLDMFLGHVRLYRQRLKQQAVKR